VYGFSRALLSASPAWKILREEEREYINVVFQLKKDKGIKREIERLERDGEDPSPYYCK